MMTRLEERAPAPRSFLKVLREAKGGGEGQTRHQGAVLQVERKKGKPQEEQTEPGLGGGEAIEYYIPVISLLQTRISG